MAAQQAEPTAEELAIREAILEQFAQRKPPSEVADLVVNAIKEDQFWIFTDEHFQPRMADRAEAIQVGAGRPMIGRMADGLLRVGLDRQRRWRLSVAGTGDLGIEMTHRPRLNTGRLNERVDVGALQPDHASELVGGELPFIDEAVERAVRDTQVLSGRSGGHPFDLIAHVQNLPRYELSAEPPVQLTVSRGVSWCSTSSCDERDPIRSSARQDNRDRVPVATGPLPSADIRSITITDLGGATPQIAVTLTPVVELIMSPRPPGRHRFDNDYPNPNGVHPGLMSERMFAILSLC